MVDLLALLTGIGLAAACGFRVFVPLLGIALAASTGHLELAEGFEWLASPVAVGAFATATALEVAAYYTPWLDNMLDAVAGPAAVVAGVIVMASVTGDMSPFLQWSLAVIAGGGFAAAVQGGTTLLRATSSATTGGLGNPVVSTGELASASAVTAGAVFAPALAVGVAVLLVIGIAWMVLAGRRRRMTAVTSLPAKPPAAYTLPRPR